MDVTTPDRDSSPGHDEARGAAGTAGSARLVDPLFDEDGYPTEETLARITEWPLTTLADYEAAMDFAGTAWSSYGTWKKDADWTDPDWPAGPKGVYYRFATGGWSGNEDVVSAIEANLMLQAIGAWSWRRGGLYEYRFPKDPA